MRRPGHPNNDGVNPGRSGRGHAGFPEPDQADRFTEELRDTAGGVRTTD